jgi:hypothetical protein
MREAAISAEEAESESQGAPEYWRVDILEEFCATGEFGGGEKEFC